MITQERLKECMHYDPDTGIFTWLIDKGPNGKAGAIAGYVKRHSGYVDLRIDWERHGAHRLAFLYMEGKMPENDTDHINGVRHDNRWCNLRAVSRLENQHNKRIQSNNTSGFTGVSWNKAANKWAAQIKANGKCVYLGSFVEKEDAIAARVQANKDYGFHENHGRKA